MNMRLIKPHLPCFELIGAPFIRSEGITAQHTFTRREQKREGICWVSNALLPVGSPLLSIYVLTVRGIKVKGGGISFSILLLCSARARVVQARFQRSKHLIINTRRPCQHCTLVASLRSALRLPIGIVRRNVHRG
jgi:hypothetical protein